MTKKEDYQHELKEIAQLEVCFRDLEKKFINRIHKLFDRLIEEVKENKDE